MRMDASIVLLDIVIIIYWESFHFKICFSIFNIFCFYVMHKSV